MSTSPAPVGLLSLGGLTPNASGAGEAGERGRGRSTAWTPSEVTPLCEGANVGELNDGGREWGPQSATEPPLETVKTPRVDQAPATPGEGSEVGPAIVSPSCNRSSVKLGQTTVRPRSTTTATTSGVGGPEDVGNGDGVRKCDHGNLWDYCPNVGIYEIEVRAESKDHDRTDGGIRMGRWFCPEHGRA